MVAPERSLLDHPKLPHHEDPPIGDVTHTLVEALAAAVARFAVDPQEHRLLRRARRGAGLHDGRHLARVHRVDARVVLASRQERRGVLDALVDVVVRRVCDERLELLGVLG